jgi:ABC-type transporter Mla MlaB component
MKWMKLLGPAAVVLAGKMSRGDIPALCEKARSQIELEGRGLFVCDVKGLESPDAVVLDALARLQLTVKRLGCRLRLRGANADLQDLLKLSGLSEVVGRAPD